MDLSKFSLEELFFTAIKAEIDSREAYSIMAGITSNAFLKDRFKFLADEEDKHRSFLTQQFEVKFPERKLNLPEVSPVPMPEINIGGPNTPISTLLQQAMDAEKAAGAFYRDFAKYAKSDKEFSATLSYFARMEDSHYEVLKREKESAEEFEAYDDFNPGMHLGP
ncbi:MAG: ferritin family protein [Thermoplasmata archaeon]|nr:ferritin family protein [Thermoplasmata archaeon]